MLQNLLQALPEGGKTATLGQASLYALIGFAVVFMGIAFLILVVWLVGRILNNKNVKETKKVTVKQDVAPIAPAPTPAPVNDELGEEEMVIIMAALMAYYEKNAAKCDFKVKRIKRI